MPLVFVAELPSSFVTANLTHSLFVDEWLSVSGKCRFDLDQSGPSSPRTPKPTRWFLPIFDISTRRSSGIRFRLFYRPAHANDLIAIAAACDAFRARARAVLKAVTGPHEIAGNGVPTSNRWARERYPVERQTRSSCLTT